MTNDIRWDKLLKIKTTGRDITYFDKYHYPYEPTDYRVLERLAGSGYIKKKNLLVDYGCGKGRVDFFMSYQVRCKSIGVEYNERIYDAAVGNMETAVSKKKVYFHHGSAEEFIIPSVADRFYFFNPFPVDTLKRVMQRIVESFYENIREMLLIFYYPSDDYIGYLTGCDNLLFVDDIDCRDLYYEEDEQEKIVIFKVI